MLCKLYEDRGEKCWDFPLLHSCRNHWWSLQSDWLSSVWIMQELHHFLPQIASFFQPTRKLLISKTQHPIWFQGFFWSNQLTNQLFNFEITCMISDQIALCSVQSQSRYLTTFLFCRTKVETWSEVESDLSSNIIICSPANGYISRFKMIHLN